jgi:hypothetical protein
MTYTGTLIVRSEQNQSKTLKRQAMQEPEQIANKEQLRNFS